MTVEFVMIKARNYKIVDKHNNKEYIIVGRNYPAGNNKFYAVWTVYLDDQKLPLKFDSLHGVLNWYCKPYVFERKNFANYPGPLRLLERN